MSEQDNGFGGFIQDIIDEDIATGRFDRDIHTRFPPEPNGYLHIGHAKAICIDFGLAKNNGGVCNLRFDDTNPSKEEVEYVDSIKEDIRWLGYDWDDRLYFASDYFSHLYDFAVKLIKKGLAYVCDLSADEIRDYRGTLTEPGKNSPYRDRSIEENLDLFGRMKAGEFEDGARVLRAKIDMASPNINMRDPVIYRILHASHHRTGDTWCIYPTYDYAHPISDAIEGITHSLCTLEFEDHRPFYEWLLEALDIKYPPKQIEFARLNISYVLTSKRKLRRLVEEGYVEGWDDPRMPTLSALRRRGYPAEAIRNFIEQIGVAKANSVVDIALLEHCVRDYMNQHASRVMGVLQPLKVVITNYPEDKIEEFDVENNPEDPEAGNRTVPFSREIYIEQEDFMENPPKKFFRLSPGSEIRLKGAYYITCDEVIKDPETGEITELRCTYDPESRGGFTPDKRRVKGTCHWVSVKHAVPAEVRLYNQLFTTENPSDGGNFLDNLNPDSLETLTGCMVEPCLADAAVGDRFQFLRKGYFSLDPDTKDGKPVFNLIVSLRDTWEKVKKNS